MPRRLYSRFFLCIALAIWWSPRALAHDYYVSTDGSDANPGTIDQPFRTIQKAASIMVPGDTTYVRSGTYRETVTPARSGTPTSPITFQPYNNESVTVSGADIIPVSSWTIWNGKIYQAPVSWNLGEGKNQVFLDGKMMIEARWPNTTLDISHPTVAETASGSFIEGLPLSTGTINDPELRGKPSDYWKGATIHINPMNVPYDQGAGYSWVTGTVQRSAEGQLSFTWGAWLYSSWVLPIQPNVPGPKNPYYLTGKLSELDAGGEWFMDSASSTLLLWAPAGDDPAQHVTELKRREFAFDLRNQSFITIHGFNIFAASINSGDASQFLVLDGLNIQYVSHYSLISSNGQPQATGLTDSGIILRGNNNVLRNSAIAFSAGNGVAVLGDGDRVFNNVIHDMDYTGTEASPIALGLWEPPANRFVIAWNTIYNSASQGIWNEVLKQSASGRILHNDIFNYGIHKGGVACNYAWGTDGHGSEIAYNLCHDAGHLGLGITLDNFVSNYIIHHNVVWNVTYALYIFSNPGPNTNIKVYNNTFARSELSVVDWYTYPLPGSDFKNNIFSGPIPITSGALFEANLPAEIDPQFVDPAHGNFQLKPNSPAIEAGVKVPPYTDGFTGKAPDIGAYDHGLPRWKAGGGQGIAVIGSGSLAPGTTATVFGVNLASGTASASSATLPFSLLGTTVTVTDGAGKDLQAPLASVSPTQVVFQVPSNAVAGVALITIVSGDGTVSLSSAPIFATYYFPHLAVGGGWQTTLTYVNSSSQAVTCDSAFFSDDGSPLFIPFTGSAISTRTDTLNPGGTLHVETRANATGPVATGWASTQCSGPIKASLLFRSYDRGVPVGEAGVNAMAAPATSFTTFAETQTGIALANPFGQPTTVTITAMNLAGQVLASQNLTLSPGQHSSAFAGSLLGLSSFTGSVRITSSTPIVSLSLNFEAAPVFSSLPPGELDDSSDLSPKTYRFPHLALGGGWQTTITFVNYSSQAVSCQTAFFSDSGGPLLVSFGGTAASGRTDAMGPGGTTHLETQASAQASMATGWASTQCSGPIKASLLYRSYDRGVPVGEAGVNAMTAPASSFTTFAQTQTGIAYANPSAQAATVTITALNSAGQVLASRDVTLSPGQHGGAFVGPLLGLSSFTGSVRITSSTPIVSLSLNFEAPPVFSSLPPGQ